MGHIKKLVLKVARELLSNEFPYFDMHKKNAVFTSHEMNTALVLLCMERVMRIELTTSAWKAEVLPLNYTRM
jgi:hypothetical protein